jgi:hypothetical protein
MGAGAQFSIRRVLVTAALAAILLALLSGIREHRMLYPQEGYVRVEYGK